MIRIVCKFDSVDLTGQFGNQRIVTVVGARETVGNHVVQQTGIQCFNCNEYGHFAKECKKPKRDTDEEPNEQELEAHYMYMTKIQEVPHVTDDNSGPTYDTKPLEKNTNDNDEDERVELANLIANLKLDIDENKKIQKQLRKENATLTHELNESKYALTESNDIRDRFRRALYQKEVSYDKEYLANIFAPNCDETLILEEESRSKLNKDLVKPYDYTYQYSFYELFTPQTQKSLDQLYFAMKLQKKLWRKTFVKLKTNIVKNIGFLPNQALISKSRQAFHIVKHNITNFQTIIDIDWQSRLEHRMDKPIAHEITVLVKDLLMPLAEKTIANAKFSNEYDLLLQECLSKYILCAALSSMTDIDEYSEMAYKYLEKTRISLKELIEKSKGKSVETKFDKPPVVCQTNAIKVSKPSVLVKPTPFLDSLEKINFSKPRSVTKTDVHKGLSKPVTPQNLPQTQTGKQAEMNKNVIKPRISKKPQVVPIRTRKPIRKANLSVATLPKKTVASNSTIQKSRSYDRLLYKKTRNITIKRFYCVEGLNHNLFSIVQFCDADIEVAFRKSTCYIRDLQRNDLLTGTRGFDLYTISLQESSSPTPICFLAKASPTQAWLWHRRCSHLDFDTINLLSKNDIVNVLLKLKFVKDQLCLSCEMGKAKRSSFKSLTVTRSKKRDGENLIKMKEKGDPCIFVGYSTTSKGYRVYNKRTILIVESIHLNFDKIKEMMSDHNSSGLAPQRQMTPDDNTSGLAPQLQKTCVHNSIELGTNDHSNDPSSSKLVPNVVPSVDTAEPSLQELDFLFSPLFEEYFTA
ncbi:retrovirus-related pol polyprotein from transposon TNT 1-94 [Tanacetum coccineum]